MIRNDFNKNWYFHKEGQEPTVVDLPHDAMIHERRSADAPGGSAHAFFPGGRYTYDKYFEVPAEWKEKSISICFEGVYKNSEIYLNDEKIYERPYGYVPFLVCLDNGLQYGQENHLKVITDNSALPNSRWYTGSGIYRPVSLITASKRHIAWNGVKITTESVNPAIIHVQVSADDGDVAVEIFDQEKRIAVDHGRDCRIVIPDAVLWNEEHPKLYTCRVSLSQQDVLLDTEETTFGIRRITWSAKGLFVNGEETLLRGGCIHHDNGILGACAFPEAEERRIRIMKECGFNAIRSAHNPCSEAMLRACDKYGMYVMDETFDMWYKGKNPYDYHLNFNDWWKEDIKAMVERDHNHPSVIMYSIGNEVSEPSTQKGIDTGREMIDFVHHLDSSRPVTCGTNLSIIDRAKNGKDIYEDPEANARKEKKASESQKSDNASLMFNIMTSLVGTGMNKAANSDKADSITSPFLDLLDIAGYNYASGRYPLEGQKHPNRVIFGSETFSQDIGKNWEMVQKYPYLVGDFMWAGWDYLGETGIGAWSYDGSMPFARTFPWIIAGSGVIDILGNPDGACRYASTIWGKTTAPVIAVRPANHPGKRVSKSVWRATNAIESWSWHGCDGNKTVAEVYADGAYVQLYVNGKKSGKKKLVRKRAIFPLKYQSGNIEAVVFNASGTEIGRNSLVSAEGKLHIVLNEEKDYSSEDLVFIDVSLQGDNGVIESNMDTLLRIHAENGELLAFGSAEPCPEERFDSGIYKTYHGRAMAVIRRTSEKEVKITVEGEGLASSVLTLHCPERRS